MEKPGLKASGVRFAPSPTGRFHLGNLRTAWISYQWAQALEQPWVVRFEDIDGPRVLPRAQEQQLEDMAQLGLVPDQTFNQSSRRMRHWDVFKSAVQSRRVYPCCCSRKDVREALATAASAPHQASVTYSGRCRQLACFPQPKEHGLPTIAWRFAMPSDNSGLSDFIVARSSSELKPEGLPEETTFVPAYHWACALDDEDGNYALLVRAHDLAEVVSPHRAIGFWLAQLEGRAPRWPSVFHASLVVQEKNSGEGGAPQRLEKRTQGVTLPELLNRGWSVPRILEQFAANFQLSLQDYQSQRVFGENGATITLQELGFLG